MLGIVIEDENHNKIFKPMAGATLGQGVPLGAWCSFEKDVAPSSNWLMAGTTFDATKYPALNLYLGTNKVPSRYDHSRLGEEETPESSTIPQTPETALVMPYDGIIRIAFGYQNTYLYISSDNGATWQSHQYWQSNGGSYTINIPFEVHKGDKVYCSNSSTTALMNVQWYTHPLFIKATSIASDSDKDSILAQIQAYNTYSTEETLTGETWLDGKPIYRKCFYSATNWSNGTVLVTDATIERCVKLSSFADNGSGMYFENLNDGSNIGNCWHNETDNTIRVARQGAFANSSPSWVIIKYTKTTD